MKKVKTKILTSVFALVAASLCLFLGISSNAMADGAYDGDYLLKKALVQDLYSCYEGGYMQTSIDISNFNNISSVSTDTGHSTVKLPNNLTGISDNNVGCQELLGGYSGAGGEFAGLIPGYLSDLAPISNNSMKTQLLEKLGYQANQNSTQTIRCATFSFDVSLTQSSGVSTNTYTAPSICAYVDGSNNIINDSLYQSGAAGSWAQVSSLPDPVLFTVTPGFIYTSSDGLNVQCSGSFDDCINNVYDNYLTIASMYAGRNSGSQNSAYVTGKHVSFVTSGGEITEYAMATPQPYIATINIFGSSDRTFTTPEVISLYQRYLNDYATTQCTSESATADSLIANGYSGPFTGVMDGQKVEGCYAKLKDEYSNPTFYGVSAGANNSLWNWSQENKSFADIIDFLSNQSNNNTHGLSDIISLTASNNDDQGTVEDETGENGGCYGNASALGWILCPIIESTANAVNGLYEKIVEPFLQLDVGAFDFGGGVYQAWQTFQSIANIIFVILFLVTIFSQLTGIGIDNLGIKRILPKLIIAAILVNLSYIVCEVLVDMSNIIGFGFFRFFGDIDVAQSASVSTTQSAVTSFATLAVGGGAAAAGVATAWLWGPALVLPILLTLITLLISIIFMFVLLGARQAGVIILVITSPIAFVLYMLPNTKPIFDKWKKFFQALLLLYPICGLLMGGAKFAGEVIMKTSDDFWPSAIASLLSVIVFFFIPSLLRNSMSAVGSIGARITGFGQNLGRGAQNAARAGVQQSGAFKNLRERAQLRQSDRERSRLERVVSRINRTPESVRSDAQRRQLAMAQSQLNRMTQEDAETTVGVKPLDFEQAKTAATSRQFNTEVDAIGTQLVNDGTAGKTGDLDPESFNKGDAFEKGSLASYIMNASTTEQRYAAVKALMSSGHHGETAVHQVMQRLAADGKFAELSQVARAVKTDRNFGGLKGAARSTYDFVNALENGDLRLEGNKVMMSDKNGNSVEATPNNFISKVNFSNMSEESLVNANKEELQRYLSALDSGELSQDKIDRLQSLSRSALANERLASRRKGAVEDTLRKIVNANAAAAPSVNPSQPNANPDQTFNVQGGANNGGQNNNQTNNNQTP